MKKVPTKFSIRKIIIVLALIVFIISVFKVGVTLASTTALTVTNAEVITNTATAEVRDLKYEGYSVKSKIAFHEVGDSVTYKITIKNNKKGSYTIIDVDDDSLNRFISYEYDNYTGTKLNSGDEITLNITQKYVEAISDLSDRNQNLSVNIILTLEDENGNESQEIIPINNSTSPKMGDDVGVYIATAIAALMVLFVLSKKNMTTRSAKRKGNHMKLYSTIILGLLIIPTVSKAVTTMKLSITIDSEVLLRDNLIFTYKIGDEETERVVKYNEKVGELDNPQRNGYTFIRWEKDNGDPFDKNEPLTEDTFINAKFDLIIYNLRYNLNGGTVATDNPTTYTVEDEITLINPTKPGYTFSGWTGSNGDELQTRVTINKGSTGNKEYKANYSPNQDTPYTVIHKTMNLDGQTYTTKDTEVLHGATDTEVKPQTNVYYGFEAPEERTITIGGDGQTELIYEYSRVKFQLTLVNPEDIETTTPTGKYYYETEITLKAKDKVGHTFKKWSTGETDKEITKKITEPLTIEAIYKLDSYTISFDSKGGSEVDSIIRDYNEELGTLPVPTKEPQIFDGWYEDEEYTIPVYPTTKATGNKTYYAKWKDKEVYTIRFDSNGGNTISPKSIEEGSALGTLEKPIKENYKFRGWYTDNNYTTRVDENTIPTESTTYYAKWVDRLETVFLITNSVTFNGKDQDINDGDVPAEYLGTDNRYIDTHIPLFSTENYEKDFEIGFTIETYDPDAQDASVTQFTFVNTKDEVAASGNIRPGFAFRTTSGDKKIYELAAATNSSSNANVGNYVGKNTIKIFREGKKLYYSINGGDKRLVTDKYTNYTNRFNTTTTFGAAVQQSGTVMRHLTGTLSNMYIKLEVDDE